MAETRATINERLKKVNIKGKPYVEVAQRVTGFWEIFPDGRIETNWLRLDDEQCVCQASVYDGEHLLAQGTAWEVKKGNINTTSYVENCETSAIGRALGNAGIGSVQSIASADEVAHAIAQQETEKKPVEKKAKPNDAWYQLYRDCVSAGLKEQADKTINDVKDSCGVSDLKYPEWPENVRKAVADALTYLLEGDEDGDQ